MVSSLQVYEVVDAPGGTTLDGLQCLQQIVFDGSSPARPKLFGLCGIAVADLDQAPDPDDLIDEELILTTLNGDLLVYDLQHDAASLGPLLFHQ